MEYIPGQTLASVWSGLNDTQKKVTANLLKDYISQLRAIPSPAYFGSIWKRALLGGKVYTPEGLRSISGPFDTDAELNEAMAQK